MLRVKLSLLTIGTDAKGRLYLEHFYIKYSVSEIRSAEDALAMARSINTYYFYDYQALSAYITDTFLYYGIPDKDARQAADVLSYSDIRGIDSHGIARLKTYCWILEEGRINPNPQIRVIRETASVATVDGDNGLGLVVAPRAFQIALDKAKVVGSGWVALRNSNHYGAAGFYAEKALKDDLIGLSMTNTSKSVAPLWGIERRLGTNPIAIAFPGTGGKAVVIDFATSTVSFGKVEIQWRKNEPLPKGWAITKHGKSCSNPADFLDGACLLPLGSEKLRGGHKGYGLAAMVDILCGVLSGANWGPFVPPFAVGLPEDQESVGRGTGQFMGAWDIAGFRDPSEFKQQIDHWIRIMKSTAPMPDKEAVLVPGEPESLQMEERMAKGIPLIQAVHDDLLELSKTTKVPLPAPGKVETI